MANININDLANEIAKQLAVYTEDVRQGVIKAIDDSTKDGVKQLKAKSPKSQGKNGGAYSKGWGRVKSKTGTGYIICNKTDYQLTHLLEYGHAKVGGGRVPARVHIRPAEESVIADFEEKVKKAIQS